tara:strand:+ start:33 stop:959 length:927 start_codon:yes stop_codon:yes gene_type:complete
LSQSLFFIPFTQTGSAYGATRMSNTCLCQINYFYLLFILSLPSYTHTQVKIMSKDKRILLTGAAGIIGKTLSESWETQERYELTLCDLRLPDSQHSRSTVADVRNYQQMRMLCQEQDVLVHLAYVPQKHLGKEVGEITDIGASMLLFEAAREAGISTIILASTNHVTGVNERRVPARLSTGDQFLPDGWYGAMKGMAEIAGRHLVENCAMRFISIRIGSFTGRDRADSLRTCSTLLTPRDCIQLFTLAVDYEGPERYLVTYGTSGNYGTHHPGFLDISAAVDVLGYQPQDNALRDFGADQLPKMTEKN